MGMRRTYYAPPDVAVPREDEAAARRLLAAIPALFDILFVMPALADGKAGRRAYEGVMGVVFTRRGQPVHVLTRPVEMDQPEYRAMLVERVHKIFRAEARAGRG